MATSITTAQQKAISELYVAFFNRAADSEGLGFWAGALAGGKSIETIAQDMYLTAPARAYYSTALTNEQFIKAFYATVLNRATPDAEGVAFWTAALNQPNATQGSVAVQIMQAVRDYVDTPSLATNAAALTAKALFAAKVDVSTAYALQGGTAAGATGVLTGVVDAATATAAIANLGSTIGATAGSTFTLTDAIGESVVGTSGNDEFRAVLDDTLQVGDSINGGAGTDTLNLFVDNATIPNGVGISNIEIINLIDAGTFLTGPVDSDDFEGATQIWQAGAAVAIEVDSGITAGYRDVTVATETVAKNGVTSLAVALDGAGTGSAIAFEETTTDDVTAVTVSGSMDNVAGAAETLTLDTTAVTGTALSALETVTLNMTNAVTIDLSAAFAANVETINAAGSTGNVTLELIQADFDAAVTAVTMGTGNDTVTIDTNAAAAASAALEVTLGAGDDVVVISDSVAAQGNVQTVATSAGLESTLITITDFAKADDVINIADFATGARIAQNLVDAALAAADPANLLQAVNAAFGETDATGDFVVFEYDGATYIGVDMDGSQAVSADDVLIELTGVAVADLTAANFIN